MDGEELAFAGIARQAELIRDGEVSSRELTELYLRRIERLGARLNAFTEVLAERALAEADEADHGPPRAIRARCSACRSRSRTTRTSPGRSRRSGPPRSSRPRQSDGPLVASGCATPGAVIIAKTTLPELAILRLHRVRDAGA